MVCLSRGQGDPHRHLIPNQITRPFYMVTDSSPTIVSPGVFRIIVEIGILGIKLTPPILALNLEQKISLAFAVYHTTLAYLRAIFVQY